MFKSMVCIGPRGPCGTAARSRVDRGNNFARDPVLINPHQMALYVLLEVSLNRGPASYKAVWVSVFF